MVATSSRPSSSSSSSSLLSTAATVAAGTLAMTAAALIVRAVKRYRSPVLRCQLKCRCGQVQGHVAAKREDSIRLWCFCQDCRDYVAYVESQGEGGDEETKSETEEKNINNNKNKIVGEYGECRILQLCKSDLHITQGQELMQLSRKSRPLPPPENKKMKTKTSNLVMYRLYTKCCHTPLYQTIDALGFVGIFLNNLDAPKDVIDQFDGPVSFFPNEALQQPPADQRPPDMNPPHFLWKMIRYHPYRKMGPFDYDMEPTYWGKNKDN